MEFHSVAEIFPLMEGAEFDTFCEDIRQNGLLEAIWTHEGRIIDGRNRYRACEKTGAEARYREWDGEGSLTAFVVSLNLHRRHLDASQRSMIAGKLATMPQGARTDIAPIGAMSQEDAAELLGVGRRSVQRAVQVQNKGAPELAAAVEAGQMAVSVAAVLADRPKEEQKAIVEAALEEATGGKVTQKQLDKVVRVLNNETTNIHVSDDSYEWYTPSEHIEAARELMGSIDLDPASHPDAQAVIQAKRFFGKDQDGLSQKWSGCVWLNPPFTADLVRKFAEKLVAEYDAGRVKAAVMIVNNATDTLWFQPLLERFPVCFTRGRVRFWTPGRKDLQARQGQAIFSLGSSVARFAEVFGGFGAICLPHDD